jgi:hypothetical protein
MRAGVDQRIMDDQVAPAGQGGEDRAVRRKARGEEQARLAAEEGGCLGLQRLMLGISPR